MNIRKIALFGGGGTALVIVTALVTMLVLPKPAPATNTVTKTITVVANPPFEVGPTYTMQSRVVNLGDPGATRYLKITVVIAFSPVLDKADKVKQDASEREIVLQDKLTTVLSGVTTDQILSPQGKDALKQSLIKQFSLVLPNEHIVDLYFPDFVMQ
jgi:flagellar protein FliL